MVLLGDSEEAEDVVKDADAGDVARAHRKVAQGRPAALPWYPRAAPKVASASALPGSTLTVKSLVTRRLRYLMPSAARFMSWCALMAPAGPLVRANLCLSGFQAGVLVERLGAGTAPAR
jgi:hypothetical protein